MARPRSDIAPRVIHAARARFLQEGVDGASLRTIAVDAHTSIGMIYYYFPTKDDLFLAVVEETYAKLLHDLEAILDRSSVDVPERLRDAFVRLGALTPGEVEVVKLIIREALVSSQRLDRLTERFQRGHFPLILGTLTDGLSQGWIDPSIPLPLALVCTAGMAAFPQILQRFGSERLPIFAGLPGGPALADLLVELLFRAIGTRHAVAQAPAGG